MLWYKTIANANFHPILFISLMNYFGFNPFPDLTPVQNFYFGNSESKSKLKMANVLYHRYLKWRHNIQHNDTQHNDIQHNDTQHKGLICGL
jgi:hypothetical protein